VCFSRRCALCRAAVDCDSAHGQASIARQNKNKILEKKELKENSLFFVLSFSFLFLFYSLFSISNMELTWRPSTFPHLFFFTIHTYMHPVLCVVCIYRRICFDFSLCSPPLFSSHTRQFNGKKETKRKNTRKRVDNHPQSG
jgi:hypothetical protein